MAFRFRLEQVLAYKQRLEDEAKEAAQQAFKALMEQKAFTQKLKDAVLLEKEKLLHEQSLTPNCVWLVQQYCATVSQEIDESEKKELLLAEDLDSKRANLVIKAQERQLLEKLKEKSREKYTREEKLKEQRAYDETATLRAQKISF